MACTLRVSSSLSLLTGPPHLPATAAAAHEQPLALLAALDVLQGLAYLHSCGVIHGGGSWLAKERGPPLLRLTGSMKTCVENMTPTIHVGAFNPNLSVL